MRVLYALCCAAALAPAAAWAGAYVPPEGYTSYTDSAGTYTAIGNVQNDLGWAVAPTVHIRVQYDGQIHTIQHRQGAVAAGGEMPFSVKVPGAVDAVLLEPRTTHVRAPAPYAGLAVAYDDTLVLHPDGSLTGTLVNAGDRTVRNPAVWAAVHGADGPLDAARNHNHMGTPEPGRTAEFVMYPDPAVAGTVEWYSCFGPAANSVYVLRAEWDGVPYEMRYESGAAIYPPEFGSDGTSFTLETVNSFPPETFANPEIPAVTGEEVFAAYRNGGAMERSRASTAWACGTRPSTQGPAPRTRQRCGDSFRASPCR